MFENFNKNPIGLSLRKEELYNFPSVIFENNEYREAVNEFFGRVFFVYPCENKALLEEIKQEINTEIEKEFKYWKLNKRD